MALCSFSKSINELALGQQRALGHRSALLQQRRFSVKTCVAQPSTSSATLNAATFELREALLKGKHFTQPQAETMLSVFPTMKDLASKPDIERLERTNKGEFNKIHSRFDQVQLLAVQLAFAVVVMMGIIMLLPLNPSSAFGMVVSAYIKKHI